MNAKTKHARVFIFDIAEERKKSATHGLCSPLQFTSLNIRDICPFLAKVVDLQYFYGNMSHMKH